MIQRIEGDRRKIEDVDDFIIPSSIRHSFEETNLALVQIPKRRRTSSDDGGRSGSPPSRGQAYSISLK